MGSEHTELNGRIVLTDKQLKVETEITTDGFISRSVTLTYGETTINGRFLRTGRIQSADGDTYFDLDTGEIGGNIKFKATSDNTSVINSIINGNSTVKNAVSTANSAASSASSAVSTATAAKDAIDNLEVGGRNCLKGTGTAVSYTGRTSVLTYYPYPATAYGISAGAFAKGTTVTISFDYDATAMTAATSGGFLISSVWVALIAFASVKGTSGHITKTITLTGNVSTDKPVYVQGVWTGDITISNVMWEIGTKATSWQEAPEDADYLREALTEATEGTTSITGGLVLSNMIAVGNETNGLRAGMMGGDKAINQELPMLWAGGSAASTDGLNDAAFRVYNNGHVDANDINIFTTGKQGRVIIESGVISVYKNEGAQTSITSDDMGTLSAALTKAGGGGTETHAGPTVSTSKSVSEIKTTAGRAQTTVTVATYTATNTETVTLFTATYKGSCVFTPKSSPRNSVLPSVQSATIFKDNTTLYSGSNGASFISAYATQTSSSSVTNIYKDGTSIATPGTSSATFNFVKGSTYTAKITVTTTVTVTAKCTYGTYSDNEFSASIKISGSLSNAVSTSYTLTSTEYVNKYYADGYMLYSGATCYAGMTSADATVMEMRSGNALLKFGADGLMQSLNGGTNYYSATPLRFSAKLTFKGGANAPTVSAKFAPDGNSIESAYESTGIFKFTWKTAQSDADYAVTVTLGSDGVGKPQSWSLYPYDVTKTYFRLEYSRNGSVANPAANVVAYVLVYRWT